MKRASRTDSPVEFGQWLARQLLEAPVKEAVHEALAEERASPQEGVENQPADTTADSSTAPPLVALVVGVATVAVVAYLLRQRRSDSDYPTRPSDVDEQTAAGDRVEAEAPVDTDN